MTTSQQHNVAVQVSDEQTQQQFQQLNLQQLLVVLIHTAAHAGFVRVRQRQWC